jgi:hypothetical protein
MAKPKKQIAKPTKKQLGFQFGQQILGKITDIANGVRDVIEKGRALDIRTGASVDIGCAPDDVLRSLSLDQKIAIEDFVATWAIEPEPAPKPPTAKSRRTAPK